MFASQSHHWCGGSGKRQCLSAILKPSPEPRSPRMCGFLLVLISRKQISLGSSWQRPLKVGVCSKKQAQHQSVRRGRQVQICQETGPLRGPLALFSSRRLFGHSRSNEVSERKYPCEQILGEMLIGCSCVAGSCQSKLEPDKRLSTKNFTVMLGCSKRLRNFLQYRTFYFLHYYFLPTVHLLMFASDNLLLLRHGQLLQQGEGHLQQLGHHFGKLVAPVPATAMRL